MESLMRKVAALATINGEIVERIVEAQSDSVAFTYRLYYTGPSYHLGVDQQAHIRTSMFRFCSSDLPCCPLVYFQGGTSC